MASVCLVIQKFASRVPSSVANFSIAALACKTAVIAAFRAARQMFTESDSTKRKRCSLFVPG